MALKSDNRDHEADHRASRNRKSANAVIPANSSSVNPIKSKIRDINRLLGHSDHLPAGVKIEKERALAGYKQDLENAYNEKRKQQMIKKYHMVRFFERQKASRNLKRLKSRLAGLSSSNDEQADLHKQIHSAEVDVNYTIYHPLTEKYLSLFLRGAGQGMQDRRGSGKGTERTLVSTKPPIWKAVEQCMVESKLDALRDGKLGVKSTGADTETGHSAPRAHMDKKIGTKTGGVEKVGNPAVEERGEESDGGFFEV